VEIDGKGFYENFADSTRIRGRGNTTWSYPKKPYRLKLDNDGTPFGLAKEKDWVLLANYLDPTHLLNPVAMTIGQMLELPFTNHVVPVTVTLNGQYQGVYTFTEQVERSKTRVNIDKKKGALLELDQYFDEDFKFKSEQIENNWLGNIPASEKQISDSENKLGVKFPEDYKEFLKITNGFSAPNDVEPSFENIENIDYLKNVDEFTIEAYGLVELENAIIVGGISEEQYFLLLPPHAENEKWKYWKFANWMAGEQPFENLKVYFEDVLKFIINEHEK